MSDGIKYNSYMILTHTLFWKLWICFSLLVVDPSLKQFLKNRNEYSYQVIDHSNQVLPNCVRVSEPKQVLHNDRIRAKCFPCRYDKWHTENSKMDGLCPSHFIFKLILNTLVLPVSLQSAKPQIHGIDIPLHPERFVWISLFNHLHLVIQEIFKVSQKTLLVSG